MPKMLIKMLIVFAAAASLGAAATFAPHMRPSGQAVADLGYSLLAGVIVGADVWHAASPVPPELQSGLMPRSSDCDASDQCGGAGAIRATLADGRSRAVDAE